MPQTMDGYSSETTVPGGEMEGSEIYVMNMCIKWQRNHKKLSTVTFVNICLVRENKRKMILCLSITFSSLLLNKIYVITF